MVNDIEIPIRVASDIAKEFGLSQVVIWSSEPDGRQHVVTYGDTLENKARAADAGNRVKHAAGWPEELQHAVPGPVETSLARMESLVKRLTSVAFAASYLLGRDYDEDGADKSFQEKQLRAALEAIRVSTNEVTEEAGPV